LDIHHNREEKTITTLKVKLKVKINNQTAPLHHHIMFGRVSRKIQLSHPKTNSSTFSCQS